MNGPDRWPARSGNPRSECADRPPRNLGLSVGLCLLVACGAAPPRIGAASPPLWSSSLRAGPHEVGFRPIVAFDPARTFGRLPDGVGLARAARKTTRPILLGVWYPAAPAARAAPRLRYRDYLDWPLHGTSIEDLAAGLAAYERTEVATEVFGVDRHAEPTPAQAAAVEALLATEVAARRGAAQAAGAFPLIIYAPGSDGTVDQNFLLFEYLASHGYVVASGSFLSPSAMSYGAQADDDDELDFRFIIQTLQREPGVDARRIGLMGHSAGAQSALQTAVTSPAVDAVVSLDTTWDLPANAPYFVNNLALRQFKQGARTSAVPVMAFASKGADYAPFADMKYAERFFVTVDLDHGEFIAHGAIGAGHTPRDAEAAPAATVRARYDAVCTYILQFFEARLAGRADAARFLAGSPADQGITVPGIEIARRDAVVRPPNPRELFELTLAQGPRAALTRCDQQRASGDPCSDDWAMVVGEVLFQRRALAPAIALFKADLAQRPSAIAPAVLLGRAELARHDPAAARRAFEEAIRRAAAAQPSEPQHTLDELLTSMWNQRALKALKELDAAGAPPAK